MDKLFGEEEEDEEETDVEDGSRSHAVDIDGFVVEVIQAKTAFDGTGSDRSGGVLWLAGYELARVVGGLEGRVLELGCGLALPSLSAARTAKVLATDASEANLRRARRVAEANGIGGLEFKRLVWPDDLGQRFDYVIAADCIYGRDAVEDLAEVIEKHVEPKAGKAVVALRIGRLGVCEFRDEMKKRFFREEQETIIQPPETTPDWTTIDRANAPTIVLKYSLDHLAKLAHLRKELGTCKLAMAGLQQDLKHMYASFQNDMRTLASKLGEPNRREDRDNAKSDS